jgi:hypothetical protein
MITELIGFEDKAVFTRHYDGSYDFYGHVFGRARDPRYYATYILVRLETSLYDVQTEALIWSGQSEANSVESMQTLIGDVSEVVIADLKKNEILPNSGSARP